MHSQHGFHVKSSSSSSHFPTIQEASQAEESGDSLGPDQWRIGCSPAAPVPRVGSAVTGLLGLCADNSMASTHVNALQFPSSPVEVVGTAHSSTGVRRLVKSVVRGLRACQVRQQPSLSLMSVCSGALVCTPELPTLMAFTDWQGAELAITQEPEASYDGLGGTYFFMNEAGRRAAIVKPCDEEPLAPNNPKV